MHIKNLLSREIVSRVNLFLENIVASMIDRNFITHYILVCSHMMRNIRCSICVLLCMLNELTNQNWQKHLIETKIFPIAVIVKVQNERQPRFYNHVIALSNKNSVAMMIYPMPDNFLAFNASDILQKVMLYTYICYIYECFGLHIHM